MSLDLESWVDGTAGVLITPLNNRQMKLETPDDVFFSLSLYFFSKVRKVSELTLEHFFTWLSSLAAEHSTTLDKTPTATATAAEMMMRLWIWIPCETFNPFRMRRRVLCYHSFALLCLPLRIQLGFYIFPCLWNKIAKFYLGWLITNWHPHLNIFHDQCLPWHDMTWHENVL